MIDYGLEWSALDTYFAMKEIATPTTPETNYLRLYAKDKSGVSALYYLDDAGVDHDLAAASLHTLLNAATHSDTVAQAASRGSLIYGNATPKWDELTIGANLTILGSDGTDVAWKAQSFIDHGALTGLLDDDHTQYRLESADHSHQSTGLQAGQLDHGLALTGLTDDDHTQYALLAGRSGTNDFTGNIGLTGNLKLPATTLTVGQITSAGSLLLHTFGTRNTHVGVNAGNLTLTATDNVAVGTDALSSITSGSGNVAVGRRALVSLTTGGSNIAIGVNAGAGSTISGDRNILIGAAAAASMTTASDTVLIGDSIAPLFTTGLQNTGIGSGVFGALSTGPRNTALGALALALVSTGDSNTGVGRNALPVVSTSNENVGIGASSGSTLTTGSQNTLIGNNSDVGSAAIAHSVAIGYGSVVGSSNYIMLGTSIECVGIGGAARPSGSGGLAFPDLTALSSMASNTAGLYADSMGANVEMMSIDESDRVRSLAWPRCVKVGTQFDKTDVTLANVTDLTHNVNAGKSYDFEALLHIDASVIGGSKFAIAGTATATSIIYHIDLLDNTTNAHTITSRQTALGGSAGQAGTTAGLCRIIGTIVVNAAGTLTVQFAQNAANGTSSVLVNSSFEVDQLP